MPVSGRMKVIVGDDFETILYNTSSEQFISKAKKYESLVSFYFALIFVDTLVLLSVSIKMCAHSAG